MNFKAGFSSPSSKEKVKKSEVIDAKRSDDLFVKFGVANFNPEDFARNFFITKDEKEAPRQWEELKELKNQIEIELKKEVFSNYHGFLEATTGIHWMQSDITEIKKHLLKSQDILTTLEKLDIRRAQSEIEGILSKEFEDKQRSLPHTGSAPLITTKLPRYVSEAPTTLAELLLERRHTEAVAVVKRVRDFYSELLRPSFEGPTGEIFVKVENLAEELASRLFREVSEKHTQVWRQTALLSTPGAHHLLIELGKAEQATQAFTQEKTSTIRRLLRNVEVAGDIVSYIEILSQLFFSNLSESCRNFLKEFSEVGTCAQFTVWVHEEVAHFASLLGKQIRTARIFSSIGAQPRKPKEIQEPATLRGLKETSFRRQSTARMSKQSLSSRSRLAQSSESLDDKLSQSSLSKFSVHISMKSSEFGQMSRVAPSRVATLVVMVSDCLAAAFQGAKQMEEVGVPVAAYLAEVLMTDLEGFFKSLEKMLLEKNTTNVEEENWQPEDFCLPPPASVAAKSLQEEVQNKPVLQSFQLVLLSCVDIIEHVPCMLDVGPNTSIWCDRHDFQDLWLHIPEFVVAILRDYIQKLADSSNHPQKRSTQGNNINQSTQVELVQEAVFRLMTCFVPLLMDWCCEVLPEISISIATTAFQSLKAQCENFLENA